MDNLLSEQIKSPELLTLETEVLKSYLQSDLEDRDWLIEILTKYMPDLGPVEIEMMCDEILNSLRRFELNMAELDRAQAMGIEPEQWLRQKAEEDPEFKESTSTALVLVETPEERKSIFRTYIEGLQKGINLAKRKLKFNKELAKKVFTHGADNGVKTALAATLQVAARKGIIKTPFPLSSGVFAVIASLSVENAKVGYQFAKGHLNPKEAVNAMRKVSAAGLASAVASGTGSAIGAALGSFFPLGGTFIGGIVGGIAGEMIGKQYGEQVLKKLKSLFAAIYSQVKEKIKVIRTNVKSGLRKGIKKTIFRS